MEESIKMLPRYRVPVVKKTRKPKKTHEEYIEEVKNKNPNIEVVGEYSGANTKITHHCLKHNIYWDTAPSRILKGVGCEMCRKEKFRQVRCKTHEQYIKEVNEISPHIEVIDDYIDARTPIKHFCKKHKLFWNAFPDNILKGNGCIECGYEKIGDKNRKTHEQYVKELKEINEDIVVLEGYIDAHTPILHKCLIDEYEWKVAPANILFGRCCPKCSNSIKRTHEDYINEVLSVNQNIEVLEKYINANMPILHKCKTHNIIWNAYPGWILKGSGCIGCGYEKLRMKNTKTHEQYVEELKEVNPNIVVLENYINSWTKILHKCLIDDNEWYVNPANTLSGNGCPKCAGNIRKTHDEYVEEVFKVNPDIMVIGQYVNARTPILHKCLLDGYEWGIAPTCVLRGNGCPVCYESSGERQIRQWLEKNNIKYTYQMVFEDCRDIYPLPFDFYLPDYNSCVEYDHKQHFEPIEHFGGQEKFEIQQKHDNMKNEYCKNNGISLLRIPYFKDIEEELNNFLFI